MDHLDFSLRFTRSRCKRNSFTTIFDMIGNLIFHVWRPISFSQHFINFRNTLITKFIKVYKYYILFHRVWHTEQKRATIIYPIFDKLHHFSTHIICPAQPQFFFILTILISLICATTTFVSNELSLTKPIMLHLLSPSTWVNLLPSRCSVV